MHCGSNKKRMKKGMGGHVQTVDGITDGNAAARREMKYGGGKIKMAKGGQPSYKHGECPKGKPC